LILTLTINPALDRNVNVDRLVFEDRAYILATSESAGGRGINASRVLHSYGAETLAILVSGGENGKRLELLLQNAGFPFEAVPVAREIRTNLTISDQQGLTAKLNEKGPALDPEELRDLEKAVERKLPQADWLMLCGSIPPSVDQNFYSRLIATARRQGVKTLLDADGEALLRGIEAGPTVVTPNHQEAERLLNRALITRAHFLDAVSRIQQMGSESAILSLGARGAVATDGVQTFEVLPPRIDAVSPIGAGDAAAAAYVWAQTKAKEFADCVRWGVAAGTASAKLPGVQFASLEQATVIYKDTEVKYTTV
jgi:1-phosphofructokinase family hexose kinase